MVEISGVLEAMGIVSAAQTVTLAENAIMSGTKDVMSESAGHLDAVQAYFKNLHAQLEGLGLKSNGEEVAAKQAEDLKLQIISSKTSVEGLISELHSIGRNLEILARLCANIATRS